MDEKEPIWARLYGLVGLRSVKEELTKLGELAEFVRMRQENGFPDRFPVMNMLFLGNPGTGKHTVAGLLGQIFNQLGVLSDGTLLRIRPEYFANVDSAMQEHLLQNVLEASKGGVLLFEDADAYYPTDIPGGISPQFWSTLFHLVEQDQADRLVILAGERETLQAIAEGLPDMKRCFPTELLFEDYDVDELFEITCRMLNDRQFCFAPGAGDKFRKVLKHQVATGESEFVNGDFVAEQLERATTRMAKRLMMYRTEKYTKEEMMAITEEDIELVEEPDPRKTLQAFDEMVISKELKNDIVAYVNYIYFIRERQQHGFMDVMPPLNAFFAGHPGTGKITAAQLLGDILVTAGILETSTILVQKREDLVGDERVSPQQAALYAYEQARGGMLYIEEGHRLLQDNLGTMALGTILAQLSDAECGDTLVVLSGNPEELTKVWELNPRLKAIFPYFFHFKDYTPDELLEIAEQKIGERNYGLHPKAREAFRKLVTQAYDEHDRYFGNALFVEKMVDKSIRSLSARMMRIRQERELTRKEVTTLMAVDIPVATSELPRDKRDIFNEKEITAALKDLDRMVGQRPLKKQIHDFVKLARHYNARGVKLNTRLSLQWCFTGNSGMGKGTVARIIARIYKAMGLIERGEVTTFKVERLIGQPEEEAMQSVGSALLASKGGLFFFDEDSNLLNGEPALRERTRVMLVNQLAMNPGAYTVIYARQHPPRQLLNDNVERVADMINVLVFEDYTREELFEILKRDLATEHCRMTRVARQHMQAFVDHLVDNKQRSHVSARLIKLVAEMMLRNRVQRLAKSGEKETGKKVHSILKQDVESFTPELLSNLTTEQNTIGFKI